MRVLTTACIILGLTVAAEAQSPTTRLRGEVEKAEGDTLMIKTVDGAMAKVALASGYSVGGVIKATAADIKKGGFIGVGARPQPDGSLLAVQVFIFPEAMRGTGEGHRPWSVLPESTMTNATVAETVSRVDGANVMLTYPGGEQKVTITPEANIIMAAPAQTSELVIGAQVAMTATKQADGSFSASRITIVKPGAQLPY
ncbi:MAG TPA: hypothetical protein VIU82_03510 [Bosea sp. (in: a-proteobacteria)]